MKKYRYKLLAVMLVALFALAACSNGLNDGNDVSSEEASTEGNTIATTETTEATTEPEIEKVTVVSTLFPQYDFVKAIGGEYVDATLILPPGIEAHSYEPTPKEVIEILASDLFLYTNAAMEPWAEELIKNVDVSKTQVIDLSVMIELLENDHDHAHEDEDEHDDEEDHAHGDYDPHYWTTPENAIIMASEIEKALSALKPEYSEMFKTNATSLIAQLEALNQDVVAAVEKMTSKTIISGGHFAFGYFAHTYGLEHVSPYIGFSPDAEPTPQKIASLIKTIETSKTKAIFYEELINPKVANVLAEETGAKLLLLHGAHNLSKEELASGVTYIEIMYANLERLKEGLGYNE